MSGLGETQLDTIEAKIQDENGRIIIKTYTKGRFLGKGGFAKCYEFKDLDTGRALAAKIIDKLSLAKERSKQKLASEINIHKSLKHPGIVRFENSFEDSSNVYILLELCPNQTLKELVKHRKKLTEIEAQCYLGQLISALIYLHNSNIIHRDLKLGNLFLGKNMELKIGDFGLAAKLLTPHERRRTVCGTPNYIAPEILNSKREAGGHSFEVDIWTSGIILYTLLVGRPPFESGNVKLTYKKIRANDYTIPSEVNLSPEAVGLIKRILVATPEKRPKLGEIMNDPFMTKNLFPRTMPLSTMSCPPSQGYLSQYIKSYEGDCRLEIDKNSTASNKSGNFEVKASNPELREVLTRSGCSSAQKLTTGFIAKRQDFTGNGKRPIASGTSSPFMPPLHDPFQPVFVELHADYTDRYGIGYVLTNSIVGFYYNDLSNILLLNHKNQYAYNDAHGRKDKSESAIKRFSLSDYPKELEKKIKVINHFKQWQEIHRRDARMFTEMSDSDETIGIKKYIKTNNGLFFRLSNHLVQMCFNDKSQIAICFRARMLIFIDKKGERKTYRVTNQLLQTSNDSVGQRLKYVVNLMNTMNSLHSRCGGSSRKSRPNRINSKPIE